MNIVIKTDEGPRKVDAVTNIAGTLATHQNLDPKILYTDGYPFTRTEAETIIARAERIWKTRAET